MSAANWLQIALFFAVVLALVKPLGAYMARVYQGDRVLLARVLGPVERLFHRAAGTAPDAEMTWRQYAAAFLAFNLAGLAVVYLIQRLQGVLPGNPEHLRAVAPALSFNTAVSFASNTNWQAYSGETTLSYATQMLALTVQNFVSAAGGMAVLVALVRGLSRRSCETVGSFWSDLVRGTLYILLPLSFVVALVLVSQGVVQTFAAYPSAHVLDGAAAAANGKRVLEQVIAIGPAASQIAIKQLGTNGGGFFGVNAAHPFENPNAVSNFVELVCILLIPAALCYTFGKLVGDTRQGWAVLAAMTAIFVVLLAVTVLSEQAGNPAVAGLGVDQTASALQAGGNMVGKETRFGPVGSALWATATTAASNGSVNAMHDAFTPLGGLGPLWLMQLGEVVYGGVGSGLYGMLVFAIVAVFVSGLMVGRTPEYLGKKIEAYEMKMASLVILVPAVTVLFGTALAVATDAGRAGIANPGPHGFTEVLYAFSSAGNNNGSAFAGLGADTPFYDVALGLAMLLGRYWVAIPVLAMAGSLAKKKLVPAGPGTLPTHSPLFIGMLVGVVVLVGALTFVPSLALGPIVEHLRIHA